MSQSKFPFDRDFQIGILALCFQRYDFLVMATDVFEDEYFEDKVLVWFFQRMKEYFIQYSASPDMVVIKNELKKSIQAKAIKANEISEYTDVANQLNRRISSQQYMQNEVVRFCRRQVGRKVYLETAPLMDTADEDDWDMILERMHEARNIGNNYLDVGVNYFNEIKERAARRAAGDGKSVSPTGIHGWHPVSGARTDLDQLLGGGLKEGQMGIWLGGTGVGKSIALPHVGRRAVWQGFKVLHYTFELDADDVCDRYDAGFTHTNIQQLVQNSSSVINKLSALAAGKIVGMSKACADRLIVKYYPTGTASVNTLRSHLRQLDGMGWVPDVIVVDYMDLLKPLTNYKDEYSDLGAIARDLRGLAGEYKVPLWTATQVNRSGLSQEVVDIEHIGDSLRKAQIADIILALCATREERANNVLRIFGAKNRNGPDKFLVEVRSAYERMHLVDAAGKSMSVQTPQQQAAPGMPTPQRRKKKKS